jgi:hypothetical protein
MPAVKSAGWKPGTLVELYPVPGRYQEKQGPPLASKAAATSLEAGGILPGEVALVVEAAPARPLVAKGTRPDGEPRRVFVFPA